jgi:Zn-dependent protease
MNDREPETMTRGAESRHTPPPDLDFTIAPAETGGEPDFVLPAYSGEFKSANPSRQPKPSRLKQLEARGGIVGSIATLLILGAKLAGPILKVLPFLPKLAVTLGSMLLSVWAYASLFGLPFAVGFVALMLIHEAGHAFAAWRQGIPLSAMVFIPFLGAMVVRKRSGKSVAEDAFIGIMGPAFGAASSLACLGIYLLTGSPIWLGLAQIGVILNLFNLLPTLPFDGGWIVPVFSPKLLAAGVILILFFANGSPFIWCLFALSLPRIIAHWRSKPNDPYFRVTGDVRWRYGMAYLGLVGLLAYSNVAIHGLMTPRRIGTVDLAAERRTPNASAGHSPGALTRSEGRGE